jgi:hypothetical protein
MTTERRIRLTRCAQAAAACAKDLTISTVPTREHVGAKPATVLRRDALETLTEVAKELEKLAEEEPSV